MSYSQNYQVEDTSSAKLAVSTKGAEQFKQAGIGLSAHWGLYSLSTHGNEWIYYNDRIPQNVYRERMRLFNPKRFCAEEWADLMVEAGMKFLLITCKHHDGFCLWDTSYTDFKVTNTSFKRDILAELAPTLRERNLGLHFTIPLWTGPIRPIASTGRPM